MSLLRTSLFVILMGLNFVRAQNFQIEAYTGVQHIHHHNCSLDDKSHHRGCTMSTGIRLHHNINRRLAIISGYTMNNMIGNNFAFPFEHVLRLDLKYNFAFSPTFPRLNLFAEAGIEWVLPKKKVKFPVYLGGQYNLNPRTDLFARIRVPHSAQVRLLSLYQFVEVGAEIGVAFRPQCWLPKYPPRACGGNPFILL